MMTRPHSEPGYLHTTHCKVVASARAERRNGLGERVQRQESPPRRSMVTVVERDARRARRVWVGLRPQPPPHSPGPDRRNHLCSLTTPPRTTTNAYKSPHGAATNVSLPRCCSRTGGSKAATTVSAQSELCLVSYYRYFFLPSPAAAAVRLDPRPSPQAGPYP